MKKHLPIRSALLAVLAAVLPLSAAHAERTPPRGAPLGEASEARVIVKFKAEASAIRARALSARADPQTVARVLDERASVLGGRVGLALRAGAAVGERVQGMRASGITSAALAAKLAADPDVEYAEPDVRMRRLALPNDPFYATVTTARGPAAGQWYLKAPAGAVVSSVNAEGAWEITRGDADVIVAVLDTGVRFDHPDLAGKLVPGYDMITDTDFSADGDGRDADASDPGDGVTEADKVGSAAVDCDVVRSSWHGTQIAGIVGAATNDGVGMAGTGWNVRVLPVRVLGKCGGYPSDIAAGIRWAAGIAVSGVPANPNPARVINLSLGGINACSATYQSAINEVVAAGVAVVVAAGNDGVAVGQPANCAGVIAVTAVRHVGTKVGFADLGPQIAIAAPGGNCVNETGACVYPILSTTDTGTQGPAGPGYTDSFDAAVGTSFSTPIVAGTLGLMLSVKPALTPATMKSVLQATARAFPTTGAEVAGTPVPVCAAPTATQQDECYCTTSTCGAGMLDARAAVAALADGLVQARITATPLESGVPAAGVPTVSAGQRLLLSSASSSVGPGVGLASVSWSLVDGGAFAAFSGSTVGSTATLVANAAGPVTVRLTVTDSLGVSASTDQVVTVVPAPEIIATAAAGGAPVTSEPTVTAGQSLTLSAGAPSGASVAAVSWSLIDGAALATINGSPTSATVTLTANAPGTVTVRLTVTDALGVSASADQSIVIAAAPPSTTADSGGGGGAVSIAWLLLLALATAALRWPRRGRRQTDWSLPRGGRLEGAVEHAGAPSRRGLGGAVH